MLMLLSRLIWSKKIFSFIIKGTLNTARDVTPYGCDEVLFRPPRGDNSQMTIFSQAARREPLQKHAAVGCYEHKHYAILLPCKQVKSMLIHPC